jgi:hypothetical protein
MVKIGKECNDGLNLRPGGATRGKWSIIGWQGWGERCGYSRLQGGSPACVDWGLFIVHPWMGIWLYTDCMLDLWGPVNLLSSMIIVVGWYPTIPLEMSIGIVYRQPTNSPVCGITWKTCTRERWDPDRPYDTIAKDCHMWPIRERAYVVLIRFVPLQGWLLIRISAILSDMSDNLFTAPTHRNACLLLWWWIKMDN